MAGKTYEATLSLSARRAVDAFLQMSEHKPVNTTYQEGMSVKIEPSLTEDKQMDMVMPDGLRVPLYPPGIEHAMFADLREII